MKSMKWMLILLVLVIGCGKEIIVEPIDPMEVLQENIHSTDHTFTTTLDFGGREATMYYDQGNLRYDVSINDNIMQAYLVDKPILCRQLNEWNCNEVNKAALIFIGMQDPYSDLARIRLQPTLELLPSRTVADVEVDCFIVAGSEECFGPDGQPFYVTKNGKVIYQVTSYTPSVPNNAFAIPAALTIPETVSPEEAGGAFNQAIQSAT